MAVKLKKLATEEYLSQGNLACAGCLQVLGFRHALKILGPNTIVINATGCMAVIMQMGVPLVPHFHVLFENAPAVISGIDDGLKAMGKREGVNWLVIAGDGGTADIGIAAGRGKGHLFIKGQVVRVVAEDQMVSALLDEARKLVEEGIDARLAAADANAGQIAAETAADLLAFQGDANQAAERRAAVADVAGAE